MANPEHVKIVKLGSTAIDRWQEEYQTPLDLTNAILDGIDLEGADLRSTDLCGASLIGACLDEVDLTNVLMNNANLSSSSMQYASLQGASLQYANLISADLRHANLTSSVLYGADMRMVKINYANLTRAKYATLLPTTGYWPALLVMYDDGPHIQCWHNNMNIPDTRQFWFQDKYLENLYFGLCNIADHTTVLPNGILQLPKLKIAKPTDVCDLMPLSNKVGIDLPTTDPLCIWPCRLMLCDNGLHIQVEHYNMTLVQARKFWEQQRDQHKWMTNRANMYLGLCDIADASTVSNDGIITLPPLKIVS